MDAKTIIMILIFLSGDQIIALYNLPKSYFSETLSNTHTIYLECYPSNVHSSELHCAFAHKSGVNVFNYFLKAQKEQLASIGSDWNCVYAQNLCRNYFDKETYKNPIWKRAANEFWIDQLIEELSQFDSRIPVLLTSQILLEVLGLDGFENIPAPDFYQGNVKIPIPANKNKLNRDLIPLYRGKSPRFEVSYQLKNEKWQEYKNSIHSYMSNIL